MIFFLNYDLFVIYDSVRISNGQHKFFYIFQLLNSPWDVCFHPLEEKIYIAMAGQHQIWEHNILNGITRAFSGDGYERNLNGSRYHIKWRYPHLMPKLIFQFFFCGLYSITFWIPWYSAYIFLIYKLQSLCTTFCYIIANRFDIGLLA